MKCMTCGNDDHGFKCPLIKAYEYYQDADAEGIFRIKRIEFVTYADLHREGATPATVPVHGTRQ